MNIFKSRAAGPVTISRPNKKTGKLEVVEVRPAGTIDTVREEAPAKRGPKPKPNANNFAKTAMQWG